MSTQTARSIRCTKCNQFKDESQFHHRGTSRQRICKTCRKAHVPSGVKRIVFLNPPEDYKALSMRISALEYRLRRMSRAMSTNPLDADDLYGAMVDEILFKSKVEDSDARILTRAKWAAKAVIRKNAAYAMHVGDESEMTTKNDDGEVDVDVRISFSKSAEEEYEEQERMERIREAIAQLEPQYRIIIGMISIGHTQREVSFKLKISEQSVSVLVKKIAAELEKLGIRKI